VNGYEISTDRARLDLDAIHGFLREAYWSPGVARDVVERSIAGSLCFGLYAPDGAQVGFARAVTDGATFAWIADVFVLEPHRRQGLARWLLRTVLEHPDLRELRRIVLATRDAHVVYGPLGFEPLRYPERWMEARKASED
jgi:GNAT superfamily N-acetyltransferase